MGQTQTSIEDRASGVISAKDASEDLPIAPAVYLNPHHRWISPLWRHYLQMATVMAVGMFAAGAILVFSSGLKTWDQVTTQYPNQALLAMAAGMSLPMVAWMLFRGMGWKNSYEMAAAMFLPVIPFLCLVWFHVTKSAQCGAYCAVTFLAMFTLMRYRRSEYSMQM